MIKINGTQIKTPSSYQWGLQDLASEDSGRTLDGIMHIDIIAQKRKLDCSWNNLTKDETSTLLKLVCPNKFIEVTYPDAWSGVEETRTFYTGDKTAPVHMWTLNNKVYSTITFNFIEK